MTGQSLPIGLIDRLCGVVDIFRSPAKDSDQPAAEARLRSDSHSPRHEAEFTVQAQEEDLSNDVSEVNSYLRQMTAKSPSERIEMALFEVLRDF